MPRPTFPQRLSLPTRLFAAAALGLAAAAAAPLAASDTGKAPVACEITLRDVGGAVEIEGRVQADRALSGEYALSIRGSGGAGSTSINQGGSFETRAGQVETLGQAVLSGRPDNYRVSLSVDVNGQHLTCRQTEL